MGRTPKAATENAEQTQEQEVKAPKIKIKRDWGEVDKLALPKGVAEKYPDMYFYWVRRDKDELRKFENWGFLYVKIDPVSSEASKLVADPASETSFVLQGDLVLMMLPMDEYKEFTEYRREQVNRFSRFINQKNENKAKAQGIHNSLSYDESIS